MNCLLFLYKLFVGNRFHTKKRKKDVEWDWWCIVCTSALCSTFVFVICSIIKLLPFFEGEYHEKRQSIILWYENVIRKVNKLSFDTFLKTIGAEMNAPDRSKRWPYFFICTRALRARKETGLRPVGRYMGASRPIVNRPAAGGQVHGRFAPEFWIFFQ